jgi:hypothetical protein
MSDDLTPKKKRDQRPYYLANRESIIKKQKERRKANPVTDPEELKEMAQYRKAYYQEHHAEINARNKGWRWTRRVTPPTQEQLDSDPAAAKHYYRLLEKKRNA